MGKKIGFDNKDSTVTLPKGANLDENTIRHLALLFEFASPKEIRNYLLEIYHTYLIQKVNDHSFPKNFERLATCMYRVIDLLGEVGETE